MYFYIKWEINIFKYYFQLLLGVAEKLNMAVGSVRFVCSHLCCP